MLISSIVLIFFSCSPEIGLPDLITLPGNSHDSIPSDITPPDTTPSDYREPFLGNYKGIQGCSHWTMETPLVYDPKIELTIHVKYGIKPNTVNVEGDEVMIDSSGMFPNPSLGSYRWYGLCFRNDSIFRSQTWGTVGAQKSCYFIGKKL